MTQTIKEIKEQLALVYTLEELASIKIPEKLLDSTRSS